MHREFVARRFTHPSLGVILLAALLLLSACGGGATQSTPQATTLPTATLIATFVPPTATSVPVEPTATPEPVAIEPTTEITATVEATATGEVVEQTPQVEEVTTTGEITATEAITANEDITASEDVTTTEDVTATDEGLVPEAITSTEEATSTEEITPTDEVTTTEEITETDELTGALPLIPPPADDMDAEITGTSAITESAITESEEVTSSADMSATSTISDARVFFLQPTTNAIVPLSFTVAVSYTGVTIAQETVHAEDDHAAHDDTVAEDTTDEEATDAGHLHLLINSDFIPAGEGIPSDELHRHLEGGLTNFELALSPGSHVLRLQYADSNHIALEGDQFRDEIVVNVVDGAPEQSVRLVSPTSGATVPTTFTVVIAATGINVEPAGPVNENAGHFHLLIDEPFVAAGEIIPTDSTHLHFGKGQLTTTVTLEPGSYLLRLQLADGTHRALRGEQYRDQISIIVAEDAPAEQVMFVKPGDGATVTSPFLVGWAASGLIIEAAGGAIRPDAGHLHVLVNEEFVDAGEVIPADETHLHFGRGQTSTELTLEPGEYTLRLQMANGAHIAHDGAQYRDEITVTVK